MTKSKWKIVIPAVCAAVALTGVFAAAAGSEGDPLVTLSYLKNVFTPQVQTMVDEAVNADHTQIKTEVDAAIQQWDATVSQAVENALQAGTVEEPASFAAASMTEGSTLTIKAGCEIIVRSGAPVCSAALIDQTDGTTLAAGKATVINHLYLAIEDCTLSAPPITVTGQVTAGPLRVRSGGGTGYSILGNLQKGAVVTIESEKVNGWYMISSGGLAGYVSADYISVNPATGSGPATLLIRGDYS